MVCNAMDCNGRPGKSMPSSSFLYSFISCCSKSCCFGSVKIKKYALCFQRLLFPIFIVLDFIVLHMKGHAFADMLDLFFCSTISNCFYFIRIILLLQAFISVFSVQMGTLFLDVHCLLDGSKGNLQTFIFLSNSSTSWIGLCFLVIRLSGICIDHIVA
jgi:hypothetical protein